MAINMERSVERSADRHTANETDRLRLARFLADLLDQSIEILHFVQDDTGMVILRPFDLTQDKLCPRISRLKPQSR